MRKNFSSFRVRRDGFTEDSVEERVTAVLRNGMKGARQPKLPSPLPHLKSSDDYIRHSARSYYEAWNPVWKSNDALLYYQYLASLTRLERLMDHYEDQHCPRRPSSQAL